MRRRRPIPILACAVACVLLLSAAPALATGIAVQEASPEQKQDAQKAYLDAMGHFNAGRFSEALAGFRASYDIVASPNSRLMIARALREMGQVVEAYDELEGARSDASAAAEKDDKYRDTASAAKAEREALRGRIGLIRIELIGAPEGTKVEVGGRAIDGLDAPVAVAPGKVLVTATAPSGHKASQELSVAEGGEATAQLELTVSEAPAEEGPAPVRSEVDIDTRRPIPLRTWAWVAGGVGAAGVLTFGIFGVMNNAKFGDLEDACPAGRCPPSRADDIDGGRRLQTIANVGLVVGIVGLGAGVTLYVLSEDSKEQSASTSPALVAGPGSLRLRGSF